MRRKSISSIGVADIQTWRQRAWLGLALVGGAGGCTPIPDVDVTLEERAETSEQGDGVDLHISLGRAPRVPIEVYATVSNDAEAAVSPPIRIDAQNWTSDHALTVTGVDDDLRDGDVSYVVTVLARAARPGGRDFPQVVAVLRFINRDDEGPRFEALGDLPGGESASYATAISEDGSVVVGWSVADVGDQAIRWTSATGIAALGGPASRAQAVSPDGKLVSGSVAEPSFEQGRAAALWRAGAAFELPAMPEVPEGAPPMFYFVDGKVVLDDGTMFGTCIQYRAYGQPLGCRWRAPAQLDLLGLSHVYAADADGHYAGTAFPDRHAPFMAQAIYDATALGYPADVYCGPTTGCEAHARDFARVEGAATIVVGTSSLPPFGNTPSDPPNLRETAFVYTADGGMTRLPDLAGGADASGAFAISEDGRTIFGFGSDERGRQAVVWIEREPRALEDLLLDQGGELPPGFSLGEVRAVSADGRILAGNGFNGSGNPEAFRISFPPAP